MLKIFLSAFMVRQNSLFRLTILPACHPDELLDVARIIFQLLIVIAFEGPGETHIRFLQLQRILRCQNEFILVGGDVGVRPIDKMFELDTSVN